MKKVLLATTILGMTSGFAAAEIAFTGEATAGFAQDGRGLNPVSGDMQTYTSFELSVAASGETDSGLAFGASTSFKSGKSYDFDGDSTEFELNGEDNDGAMDNPEVFVSGDFGKVAFKVDGFDELANDSATGDDSDVKYTHSIAGLDIAVVLDIADEFGNTTGNDSSTSVSLGYTVSGITLSGAYDDSDDSSVISAEGTFGAITAGLTYEDDQKEGGPNDTQVATLALEYAADAFSVGVELSDDDSWSATAGYSANGLSLDAETNNDDEWVVTAEYDLGGGLTAEAGTDSFDNLYVGAKMAF